MVDWKVHEYLGVEVYRNEEDLKARRPMKEAPILGDTIIVSALIDWCKATVKKGNGFFYAESENYVWPLEFNKDDRKCWVSTGMINKKCLSILKPLKKESS